MTSFYVHTSTFPELGAPPDTSSSHGLKPIRDFKLLGTKRSFTIIIVDPRARSHDIPLHSQVLPRFVRGCHQKNPVCTLIFRDPLSTRLPNPFSFFRLSTLFRCCCDGNWSDDWSVTKSGMFIVAICLLQVSEMAILFSIVEYLRDSPFSTTISWMYSATSSVSCSIMVN